MKKYYFCAAIVAGTLAACVAPRSRKPPSLIEVPKDANFVLSVSEAVLSPEEDTSSYATISVGGRSAGRTPAGPRSSDKKWGARFAPGNHLFRFEYWIAASSASEHWSPLNAQWQPIERFVRVNDRERLTVTLKFHDGARKHSYQISRDPVSAIP
ncbi:MAG: hypothetical protein A3J74_11300 [Elusimicrobia bacterium RIFCSPHIGHO2_02_FULL_57_9]|nr:MAG: hypothetical protein A3J74_11300 [Elusimicrobia bacterium RIFCSPHIGHO2_02_FULL_57_9]